MLTFIRRLIGHLLVLLMICLPLEILGWVILLPVCYFSKSNQLPKCLRWFDNADMYLGRDTSTYDAILSSGIWNRYTWLAFRNPLNYFGYLVLGYTVKAPISSFTAGNPNTGDTTGHTEGWVYNELNGAYEYYLIHKWSATKCLRFRLGWKIGDPDSNPIGSIIEWVLVIQPYKDYTGS